MDVLTIGLSQSGAVVDVDDGVGTNVVVLLVVALFSVSGAVVLVGLALGAWLAVGGVVVGGSTTLVGLDVVAWHCSL